MSSGSLDTNALLRLLLNDIPEHHLAVKVLLEKSTNQFSIADTAMIELVFVLERHYSFTRQQIEEAVYGLAQLREITCNYNLFEQALPLFVERPRLSFEDCCLAVYAKLNNAEPLWTFDKKLASQTFSARLVEA
jgi:predicted nucleic-acid-binding protein